LLLPVVAIGMMVILVVVVLPVAIGPPPIAIGVPPPVISIPTLLACFLQFPTRVFSLPAFIAPVLNGLVQIVICAGHPLLTTICIGLLRCGECQNSC